MHNLLQNSTQNLRRVLAQAAQLAVAEGKEKIEPTHLFYGLTNQAEPFITINSLAPTEKKAAHPRRPKKASIILSPQSKRILVHASQLADSYNHPYIGTEHLFLSLLESRNARVEKIVRENKLSSEKIRHELDLLLQSSSKIFDMLETILPPKAGACDHDECSGEHENAPRERANKKKISALEFFSTHLTAREHAAKLDPLIGRTREVERLMHILLRRTKNNPVLLGHPGVGKTAIVEGLAKNIADGTVPAALAGRKIYSLNLATLVAGSAFRGELEMRFKSVLDEVREDPSVILFIDEIHNVVGAGSSNGSLDIANILKPALARGEVRCIGATTYGEYKKYIEDDPALERRFQSITVEPPSYDEAEQILKGLRGLYEGYHQVRITDEAIEAAVRLSDRYIAEKFLPDKAIDVIDEASAKAKLSAGFAELEAQSAALQKQIDQTAQQKEHALYNEQDLLRAQELHEEELRLKGLLSMMNERPAIEIAPDHIAEVVATTTGVPIASILDSERRSLLSLEEALSKKIVGQDSAKKEVARFIRRAKAGLVRRGRPIASFLFLGPSGVGKTELAKTLASEIFGPHGLIKLDMSEFAESFTVSRLIGAPSGYVGYKEGGRLTEAVRQHPYSLVLFDEIEKAHPRVHNILLQILEDGVLTDAAGKRVDFSNTILALTTNIGARKMQSSRTLGFAPVEKDEKPAVTELALSEVKDAFNPELINRIDGLLTFSHLTKDDIATIAERGIADISEQLREQGVALKVGKNVAELIAERCFEPAQGARKVRHEIEHTIENMLAEKLLSYPLGKAPSALALDVKGSDFVVRETRRSRGR